MSEAEVISSEDLRNRMFDVLKKRGLIDVLKVSRETTVSCTENATSLILCYFTNETLTYDCVKGYFLCLILTSC